jgi:undecaprenyl-diphosphatase
VDTLIKFGAQDLIVVPLLYTLYLVLKLRDKKRINYLILLIAGGFLSLVLAKIGAHLYYHPRPFLTDHITPLFKASHDNGFPSDHTLLAAYLGFAVLSHSRRDGLILLAVALLVGWARVAAGVHHFTDILGSFVITAIAYFLVNWLLIKYKSSRRKSASGSISE